MEKIDYLIIQSTDTGETKDFGKEVIIAKHTDSKRDGGFGWNRPGIDYLIPQDGSLQTIINEASPTTTDLWGISHGKKGITGIAKHIAYVGGRTLKEAWDKDTRTDEQKATLEAIIKFYILRFPDIIIAGFNEIPAKADEDNPGFEVAEWLRELEIQEHNIFKK
ncbi:hypothetical protein [Aquimarina agarilytica]|uniref:hypothetical protein n=1 Tax=Aquimarina agarilytica TaxID=1087449 RepID=UPI000287C6B8|nr:hypothetical protein [Aquimarina agarilytica]